MERTGKRLVAAAAISLVFCLPDHPPAALASNVANAPTLVVPQARPPAYLEVPLDTLDLGHGDHFVYGAKVIVQRAEKRGLLTSDRRQASFVLRDGRPFVLEALTAPGSRPLQEGKTLDFLTSPGLPREYTVRSAERYWLPVSAPTEGCLLTFTKPLPGKELRRSEVIELAISELRSLQGGASDNANLYFGTPRTAPVVPIALESSSRGCRLYSVTFPAMPKPSNQEQEPSVATSELDKLPALLRNQGRVLPALVVDRRTRSVSAMQLTGSNLRNARHPEEELFAGEKGDR